MAEIKNAFNQKVLGRGVLAQTLIALIVVIGVSQWVSGAYLNKTADTTKVGPVGPSGVPGVPGPTGEPGPQGDVGPTGTPGETGKTGAKGADGSKGETGATGATGTAGTQGSAGAIGATGPAGAAGTFSAAYGQLSLTSQELDLYVSNEWVPVPFSATGPSSNMTVSTTSPAKMTMQKTGVYQVNVSVYFVGENADEGPFMSTDYKLGIRINGGSTTAVATLRVDEAGLYSFSYSNIMQFSAGDYVEFYMTATDTNTPPFANYITLENSHAYVMQIAD